MLSPIFISSTFVDLEVHRRLIFEAITKLNYQTHGMEFFGALPETPKEECLRLVRTASVYIGIFGMRYGAIDSASEKSLTQLEYEEAISINLPCLIYLIDEDKHPLLPRHVDTGSSAEKLKNLKTSLKSFHVVNFFNSAEDLVEKITKDVLNLLSKLTNIPSAQVLSQIANNSVKRYPLTQPRFDFLHEKVKPFFNHLVPEAIMREAIELTIGGDKMAAAFVLSRGTPMPLDDAIDGLIEVDKFIQELLKSYKNSKSDNQNV